ncbi:MAG TPA: hypothetical protein VNW06_06340, partial [Cytophagaceae bacterium]|nr:hypothetical protein [Cytophagaceae bacterium]
MKSLHWILIVIITAFSLSCARKTHTEQTGTGQDRKGEKLLAFEHFYNDGVKFYILEKITDAESNFSKAYQLSPDNAAVNYMLGKIALSKK